MQWIAPTERDSNTTALEKRLWDAAEYKHVKLGLIARGDTIYNDEPPDLGAE